MACFIDDHLASTPFTFPYFVFYVADYPFKHRHPNACTPVNFIVGVLPSETSGVAGITEEAMEILT